MNIVDAAGLTFLHVFPYSPRPGTPAARMPQLPRPLIKQRAQRLREAGERVLERFLEAEVGKRRQILVERQGTGHTQHFAPVRLNQPAPAGTLTDITIIGRDTGLLIGEIDG
jgi:threonylcarbamoyladenosine tRNA methylthiotransferase MtaB